MLASNSTRKYFRIRRPAQGWQWKRKPRTWRGFSLLPVEVGPRVNDARERQERLAWYAVVAFVAGVSLLPANQPDGGVTYGVPSPPMSGPEELDRRTIALAFKENPSWHVVFL